jgi:hypothetical protein
MLAEAGIGGATFGGSLAARLGSGAVVVAVSHHKPTQHQMQANRPMPLTDARVGTKRVIDHAEVCWSALTGRQVSGSSGVGHRQGKK